MRSRSFSPALAALLLPLLARSKHLKAGRKKRDWLRRCLSLTNMLVLIALAAIAFAVLFSVK